MKVPISWLREYVDINLPAKELAHRLTMTGVEVGGVEVIGDWNDIFVGLVTKVEPHPNADRLLLATVDLVGETHTVVCGAPNVAPGQKIAFAKEGAVLFNAHTGKVQPLKAARIRDVLSAGMVCSELELGLGEDHEGILVLDEDTPLGVPLADYMGDVVLELEPTPNRPDCFSVLGIAHEVAAITGTTVTEPRADYSEDGVSIEEAIRVEIADPDLCARYTASLIKGVKVGPSPRWLQERLIKAGQRPINNVVDITNYVMLEYGQPLHAFDYQQLSDRTIIIRQAKHGEIVTTLDEVERKLNPSILTIANSKDAIALAGVMGGASSEITESTTDILLESANFSAPNTRRTSTVLKLRTEASTRFEKGLRPELAYLGLRRATQLIVEIAEGKAAKGIVDMYPGRKESAPMEITFERVKKVLGLELSLGEIKKTFTSLGFEIGGETKDGLLVIVPYWRSDVTIEDDLVEEVARTIGYDRIPTAPMSSSIPEHRPQPLRELREQIRDILAAAGMQETISYSLTSLEALEKVNATKNSHMPLRMANPMSNELEYLRTTLKSSILMTLAYNLRHKEESVRIFEVGRLYLPREEGLPEEREIAIGVFAGQRFPTSWTTRQVDMDFYDAKGMVEAMLGHLGAKPSFEPANDPALHPGKSANIMCGKLSVGVIGEVHPKVLERFDIEETPVALFEIDIEALSSLASGVVRKFNDFSRFPASTRDIALIVDGRTSSEDIKRIIERPGLVTQAVLFDVYIGKGIPEGKKSMAYSVQFQSPSATLTAQQVNKALQNIIGRLQKEVGAQLRV